MSSEDQQAFEKLKVERPYLAVDCALANHEMQQFSQLFKKDLDLKKRRLADTVLHGDEHAEIRDYIRDAEAFYRRFLEMQLSCASIDRQSKTLEHLEQKQAETKAKAR